MSTFPGSPRIRKGGIVLIDTVLHHTAALGITDDNGEEEPKKAQIV